MVDTRDGKSLSKNKEASFVEATFHLWFSCLTRAYGNKGRHPRQKLVSWHIAALHLWNTETVGKRKKRCAELYLVISQAGHQGCESHQKLELWNNTFEKRFVHRRLLCLDGQTN